MRSDHLLAAARAVVTAWDNLDTIAPDDETQPTEQVTMEFEATINALRAVLERGGA